MRSLCCHCLNVIRSNWPRWQLNGIGRSRTERVNDTKAILSGEASRNAQPVRDPNIDRMERLIREQFCLPCEVTFSESQAKGKVTFIYHSLDELPGLMEAWRIEYQ
jgi:hypothetical protein